MNPTNDYIFRRIFGQVGNEEITKGLIGSIIAQNIETINLSETTITEQNIQDEKVGILDIKARLNNEILCDVEMQVSKDNNIDKRLLFYWSKLYTSGIHQGEDYHKLHKSIVILIANFKIQKLKHIYKFHTKWHIREEEYRKILLTDTLEIHIIELPKLLNQLKNNDGIENNQLQFDSIPEKIGDKNMDNNEDKSSQKAYEEKLILWSMFFMQPDFLTEEDLAKHDDIRKAKEELDKLRQNKKAQRLAELRMKYILEQNAIRDSALEEGFENGFENGFEEGKKKSILEIAKELLILNMPIEQISQITKLTEDEINSIE